MEEALTSPTYPPAEASLALLAFLRDELPLGGTAAEARFLRLFPLLVSRIFGEINANDGFRHEPGGWLGRKERWSVGSGAGGAGGTSRSPGLRGSATGTASSSSRAAGAGGDSRRGDSTMYTPTPARGSGVHRSGTPGSSSVGGNQAALSLDHDPVVQLLSGNPRALQGGSRTRQPTLIDAISDESVHRPGVRFSFDFRALPLSTQAAFVSLLLLDNVPAGTVSHYPHVRPNAARLGSVLRYPIAEQADLRFALQRCLQLTQYHQQQRRGGPVQRPGGLSPLGVSGVGGSVGVGASASRAGGDLPTAAMMLPLPADARAFISLTMLEYYLFFFVRFAAYGQSSQQMQPPTADTSSTRTSTTVAGTPANTPRASTSSSSSSSAPAPYNLGISGVNRYSYSSRGPYGERVYLHLFQSYIERYLPHSKPMMPPHLLSASSPSSHGKRLPRPPVRSFVDLDQDAELFLRLVLELWLDGGGPSGGVPTTAEAVLRLPNRGGSTSSFGGPMTPSTPLPGMPYPAAASVGLEMSFELASVAWGAAMEYAAPKSLVKRGIRQLVNHIVSDPGLGNAVAGEAAYTRKRGMGGMMQLGTAAASVVSARSTTPPVNGAAVSTPRVDIVAGWCLPPAMTATQAPFYNYVRMNLRHAPVHVSDSAFFSALNAWLVWLEPWNTSVRKNRPVASTLSSPTKAKKFLSETVQSLGGKSTKLDTYTSSIVVPKATAPSSYTSAWEPYIAANLHLFTVPLAIFLRRARELDFSPRDFHKSLSYVQKVFRVYTPEIVQVLNRLLSPQSRHGPLNDIITQHERILGEFCPPSGLSLSSCVQDMHNLLEEIYLQHQKKVRELDIIDRFAQRIEGLLGQGTKGDEHALERLLAQARVIVDLPVDYEVLPGEKKGAGGGSGAIVTSKRDEDKPERVHGGFLTEAGRHQILMGTRKCSAMDVAYIGDPMYSRVKSYEIPFLVDWTVRASDWLNDRLGLVPLQRAGGEEMRQSDISDTAALVLKLFKQGDERKRIWFRFNLRFLADYRNLICFAILRFVFKTLRALFS